MESVVTENALMKRVNSKLNVEGTPLRKSRPSELATLGLYYVVNNYPRAVEAYHVDLETWARDEGVMRTDEVLGPDIEVAPEVSRDVTAGL